MNCPTDMSRGTRYLYERMREINEMYKPSCSLLLMSEKVLCACNIYQHSQHLHPHDNKESLDSMKCCKAYSSLYRIDSELISYRRIAHLLLIYKDAIIGRSRFFQIGFLPRNAAMCPMPVTIRRDLL